MKIGISGFGFVGGALYQAIKNKDNVEIFDPAYSEYNNISSLLDTDVVFICAPTPLKNGEMDARAINSNLEYFSMNNYKGLVVIKSTIHPQYIKEGLLINLKVISNPEFLNEHNAIEDFKNQSLIVIGGRFDLSEKLKNIYGNEFDINPEVQYEFMRFEEALIFKYLRNIKIGYEVLFWEFVNETAGNYRKYNKVLNKLPIKVSNICADGERGFGGHCLPKDTTSYPKHDLTKFMLDYNKKIRK